MRTDLPYIPDEEEEIRKLVRTQPEKIAKYLFLGTWKRRLERREHLCSILLDDATIPPADLVDTNAYEGHVSSNERSVPFKQQDTYGEKAITTGSLTYDIPFYYHLRSGVHMPARVSSAYDKLSRSNEAFKYGKRPQEDDEDDKGVDRQPAPKRTKMTRKVVKTKRKALMKPPVKRLAPVTESWRPAGGESFLQYGNKTHTERTDTLGIARLVTWRAKIFIERLKTMIEKHGQVEEISTNELLLGGESLTDVFVRFRSELVAEAVKENIDGELLECRKLQVEFAW